MYNAIFWDNDGVLVNTEHLFFLANLKVFENLGFVLSKGDFKEYYLKQNCGTWHWLTDAGVSVKRIKELKAKRDLIYSDLIKTTDYRVAQAEPVIKMLHRKKIPMAIVTSSEKVHFTEIHSKTKLLRYFKFVIYGADCVNTKPDPEPYQKAMYRLGVKPEECLVIEDSPRGLESAKAAGMKCCIILNDLIETADCENADFIVDCISDIPSIIEL